MSKNDAMIYAPDQIRVNSIHPGFIFTGMLRESLAAAGTDESEARTAIGRRHPLGTGDPTTSPGARSTSPPTSPAGSPAPSS